MTTAVGAQGPPTLLITCAGIVVPGLFEGQAPDAFRRTMDVNHLGTLHLIRAALPAMRTRGHSRIVMIASGAALLGLYGYTSYAPSKFAVRGLAEALRSELGPDGIAVSVVYPLDTDTPCFREEVHRRPEVASRLAAAARAAQRRRGRSGDLAWHPTRPVRHNPGGGDVGAQCLAQRHRAATASVLVRSADRPATPARAAVLNEHDHN